MPTTKTTFSCGHRGHGAFCHRCQAADRLLEQAETLKKSKESDRDERMAALKTEADRLRALPQKKYTTTKVVDPVAAPA